jgi:hydrogenase maturation protein HypF
MTAHAAAHAVAAPPRERVRLTVGGIVQGVGFRPSVYRCARQFGVAGFVANSLAGVTIEAEGSPEAVAAFLRKVIDAPPAGARVVNVEVESLAPTGEATFEVRASSLEGERTATVLPDLATCDDCLRELFDADDRRHRYPFINCTHCGPRHSIVEDLPYDRSRTSMRGFPMCAACRAEYEDPADRRFHAEPIACAACGPQLALWDAAGAPLAARDAALLVAAVAIRDGAIVAVKGLGGFHFVADARNDAAVRRLRERKLREEKPFAVMFPSRAVAEVLCDVGDAERALLMSPQSPIVLVRRRERALAESVAPHNPWIGAMLPYTPLHHLLLAELRFPVVATSGNRSDEPIATDNLEALSRLDGIADCFLVHDRPIVRAIDDSVVRIIAGRPMLLRRARGFAPAPAVERPMPEGILALGGHMKNAIALTTRRSVILGPHIGDLDTVPARDAYDRAVGDLMRLHDIRPRLVARDAHPDYYSSRVAEASGLPVVTVQHHLAHVVSCMAEQGLAPPVLGVAWDGTGYGPDGTVWGGEFLVVTETGWRRAAHLRTFRLPGGESAVREPRRSAVGLLFAAFGREALAMSDLAPVAAFTEPERATLAVMLERGLNAPVTSSAGRLFDAVAALTGLRQRSSYEGQAAMLLEWLAEVGERDDRSRPPYPFPVVADGPASPLIVDWRPALCEILADVRRSEPAGAIARAFHLGLATAIAEVAVRIGEPAVVLTGGCFQNAFLAEAAIGQLRHGGLTPHWHRSVPPNDGGLAVGQAVWAARLIERGDA